MVGRFIGRRAATPMSFDVAEAQRMEAGRQARIRERAARATPQAPPQVQREVRQTAPPLQLAPQRYVDSSEIATAITGRGPQGLDTSYTVNLQPDSQKLMSRYVMPESSLANKQQYLQSAAAAPTGYEAFIRNNPGYVRQPKEADFLMKGIPAVDMKYGRVTDQNLPIAMEKQGSYYTALDLGTGKTKPVSTSQLLDDYETAMDSFAGSANDRFMRGNNYNGFEPVHPSEVFSRDQPTYNAPRYDKEGNVIPLQENGITNPVYLQPIPQRLTDAIDKNVMATSPSQNVTEQMINSGSVDPNIARTVAQVKAPVYSTAEIPSGYQRPDQAPTQGSYSMQTFEDPAVFGAYEKNFAQAGNELMLPSTAIRDRTVVPSRRQGPGGQLAPIESEPVLSPYPLALGGTYAKSDLTAKSSIKADLGSDERLAYMLRSERQPDLPEFGDRSPDYVKYVPQTQTIGNQFQETMTDAHDVRRRIAAQANNMGNAARIAEQGAARTTYPRNVYDVQVDQFMRPVPGAFENPAVMTADDMRAARMRQDATEMQHRLTFTDDAIAEAYNRLDAKAGSGIDTQRVLVSQTGPDGIIRNQAHNISLEEQLQMGAELQRQGYARDVNLVPQGYSVTYGEEYPAWEGKNHQLNVNPRIFGSSVPIVAVPEDLTGWGRAVQLR